MRGQMVHRTGYCIGVTAPPAGGGGAYQYRNHPMTTTSDFGYAGRQDFLQGFATKNVIEVRVVMRTGAVRTATPLPIPGSTLKGWVIPLPTEGSRTGEAGFRRPVEAISQVVAVRPGVDQLLFPEDSSGKVMTRAGDLAHRVHLPPLGGTVRACRSITSGSVCRTSLRRRRTTTSSCRSWVSCGSGRSVTGPPTGTAREIFLYPTLEAGDYSRHRVGLQHLSFNVPTRADVHRVHEWAKARGHEIVHEPRLFPEYHERFYATFFLDLHGFMLEAVTYEKVQQ